MSTSSKISKPKKEFKSTLFNIVNEFSLDEFKTFTNFPKVMARALIEKTDSAKLNRLENFIKQNFKVNIPNEKMWKKGAFGSLQLTNEFYASKTAVRIFRKLYGIRNCTVELSDVSSTWEREDVLQLSSDDDDDDVEKIDLTKDEHSTNDKIQPPRRLKYPRKQAGYNLALPSGIATYASTSKFVDQIPPPNLAEGISDIRSTDPAAIINQPNATMPNKSSIIILSDITLVKPTELRDMETDPVKQTSHSRPDELRPSLNIVDPPVARLGEIFVRPLPPNTSRVTSQNVGHLQTKPKIGPKSRMNRSTINPPLMSTQDLLQDLMTEGPEISPSSQTHQKIRAQVSSQNVPHRKPKIGPKSRMNLSTVKPALMSSQELAPTDPSKIPVITQPDTYEMPTTSIIRPSTNSPLFSSEQSPRELMHTDQSLISTVEQLHQKEQETTVVETTPKPKIGPNFRTNASEKSTVNSPWMSTQELLQGLMHTDPTTVPSPAHPNEPSQCKRRNEVVRESMRKVGPNDQVSLQASSKCHTVRKPESNEHRQPSTAENKITQNEIEHTSPTQSPPPRLKTNVRIDGAGNLMTEIPCEGCHAHTSLIRQLQVDSQGAINIGTLPVENVSCPGRRKSPMNLSVASDLINNFQQSFDAQLQHIQEHMLKYMAETEPNALSLKTFWYDFIKSEYETDNSAAETQLHNCNENIDELPMENHSQPVLSPNQLDAEVLDDFLNVQIKMEKIFDQSDDPFDDVQIIEVPPSEPIEILMDSTQDLVDNLQVDDSDDHERLIGPFAIPHLPLESCRSTAASSSKGFLTALPNIPIKKRTYAPLEIKIASKIPPIILPNHDFSQQPETPPSKENYEIEECTMTDTQMQRYELLNNENTLFLSSQLEMYAFNAGKPIDPKATSSAHKENARHVAQKRLSTDTFSCQPYKRRCIQTINRELNWKIMSIRTAIFKPLPNNAFHLELQLRNNFDTFSVHDQPSIKRMLHLSEKEWKHIVTVLTALKGFRYDFAERPTAAQKTDLMSRVMNCFVRSVPLFVSANIQFDDFMGHRLRVTEQQPLKNKCTDSAIDPDILKNMKEFKKKFCM